MGIYAQLLDALGDNADKDQQVIKAGTLRVTRGTGLVSVVVLGAAGVLDVSGVDFIDALSAWQKWTGVLVIAGIWGLVTAADGIARAIATVGTASASSNERAATAYSQALDHFSREPKNVAQDFHVISPPIAVRRKELAAEDELGWTVVGSGLQTGKLVFLVTKDAETTWVSPIGITWNP
jgi:hypothetical protein